MAGRHDSTFSATLTGLWDQIGARPVTLPDGVGAEGRVVLLTGASRGLGLALATQLAQRGAAVRMACRSRLDEAPAEVRAAVPGADVAVLPVDLSKSGEVEALLDALAERGEALDRVVLNAGVVPARSRQTDAGLDIMVHVNFLANVQLVTGLRERGLLAEQARIVIVGSEAHRSAPPVDLEGWMVPVDYPTSGVLAAYGSSKRLLHTWAEALSVRAEGVEVIHLCPGAIASDIAREAPAWLKVVVRPLMALMFPSPARAARSVLWAVLSPELDGRTGVYLHLGREKAPAEGIRDPRLGDALWDSAHRVLHTLTIEEE
jgi:NAD(P)-dependent dehydrogenase (short-subunit alcohol dehydrogenase family)